jgi:hypothetical protein
MRKIGWLCFFVLVVSFNVQAQNLLPSSFGNWKQQGPVAAAMTQEPETAAFHEYGLSGSEQATYARGADTLTVTLWKFQDPTGGYGGYSYLRTADMERSDIAEHASYSANRALILLGNLVLEVSGQDVPKMMASLAGLKKAVEPSAETGPFPDLWQFLPLKGLEDGTNHYVLGPTGLSKFLALAPGDWLGFSDGAEAEVAKYRLSGNEVSLLIADFPTPQFAQKRLEDLQQQMKINSENQDPNQPALYAKRTNTLVVIVAGAKSKTQASVLLDQIDVASEVTWNEPTFQFTQPNIGTVIVGTIVGTGVICAFAVVAGIAFGGVRIVTKIAFPAKVFDRPSQVQILQLGLSSKPINAEDFYGIDIGRKSHARGGKL